MPIITAKGDAASSVWQYRHRSKPYLSRNVRRVIESLTMGSTLSHPSPSREAPPRQDVSLSDDEEDGSPRPAKRRRINHLDDAAPSLVQTQSSNRPSSNHSRNTSQGIRPPSFTTRRKGLDALLSKRTYPLVSNRNINQTPPSHSSNLTHTSDELVFQDPVIDFHRALRVEITRIMGKQNKDSEIPSSPSSLKTPINIKIRCSLILSYLNKDIDDTNVTQDYTQLYRTSKIGTIMSIAPDRDVTGADVILPEPFIIQADELYVNRKIKSSSKQGISKRRDAQYVFGLADKYRVDIWMEPVGYQKDWPPVLPDPKKKDSYESGQISKALDTGKASTQELRLFSTTSSVLDPERQSRPLDLKLTYETSKLKSLCALKVDINWSLPSSSGTPISKSPRADISPAKTLVAPRVSEAVSPPRSREDGATTPDSPNTPSGERARRRSNAPVSYNVKVLSDLAKGLPVSPVKLFKLREGRSPRTNSDIAKSTEDFSVIYTFGRADSAELGIKQQTVVSGFTCPFCNYKATCSDGLKIHLNTDHSKFRFHLRRSSPQRLAFFVDFSKQASRAILHKGIEQARTLQLNRPVTLFDLEKFLTGDDSWVKTRHGIQNDHWAEHSDHVHDSSSSGSPHNSRHSSPNTSNDTDEVMEVDVPAPKKSLPTRTRKVFYVPKTSKPLYDTVTRRLLKPGEEIPSSDDEKDEGWLHQKYRDIVLDYKDVTVEEKDYINQWNLSIVAAHLTSETHLTNAVLHFVEHNKIWFARKQSRKVEFGKHMEMFLMKGVIDQDCIHKCVEILKQGEKLAATIVEEEIPTPPSPSRQRGVLDCICCIPTEPPDRVICSGKASATAPGPHAPQTAIMAAKPPRPRISAFPEKLEFANKHIDTLIHETLPQNPQLLTVPTTNPYLATFPYENLRSPFDDDELKQQVQYITLLANTDRGVGFTEEYLLDETNGTPYGRDARSSTTTPNPSRDPKKPAVKLSLADYKSVKSGGRPTPKAEPRADEERKAEAAKNVPPPMKSHSATSREKAEVHGSVPDSLERSKKNGVSLWGKSEDKSSTKDKIKASPLPSSRSNVSDQTRISGLANGQNHDRKPPSADSRERKGHERNLSIEVKLPTKENMKHPLPPRPASPKLSSAAPREQKQKRPPEQDDSARRDKGSKTLPPNSKSQASSQNNSIRPSKPTSQESKLPPKPRSPIRTPVPHSSTASKKPYLSTPKSGEKKLGHKHTHSNVSLNSLPPLLSPLPPDLGESDRVGDIGFGSLEKKSRSDASPQKSRLGADLNSKKQKITSATASRDTTPSKIFVLPGLLSPTLPDIVEQELVRLQKLGAALTVEGRHELARQPDTPGVARKKPKPPSNAVTTKSSPQSSIPSNDQDRGEKAYSGGRKSLLVRISYKKRQAKDIERLLATKPVPNAQFKKLETERLAKAHPGVILPQTDEESEADIPLSRVASKTTSHKRPSDNDDRSEPPLKRTKGADSLEPSKSQRPTTPSMKPSATSVPPKVDLLATPKKGDSLKPVAMRKVDSTDSHARTPQMSTISTPVSAEKPRVNGDVRTPELERMKAEEGRYTQIGTKLKRKMDGILRTKEKNAPAVSESERKLGLCIGLESLAAYMIAFHARDRSNQIRQSPRDPTQWEQFMALWQFMDRSCRSFPLLYALVVQLGGISRGELNKLYVETKEAKYWEKICLNSKNRDAAWIQAHKSRQPILDLIPGIETLGPWSSVNDATSFTIAVLTAFSKKERLDWKKDTAF
ncbi:hypothetical protein B7463_g2913, partial [Scytalidium lignicola]